MTDSQNVNKLTARPGTVTVIPWTELTSWNLSGWKMLTATGPGHVMIIRKEILGDLYPGDES